MTFEGSIHPGPALKFDRIGDNMPAERLRLRALVGRQTDRQPPTAEVIKDDYYLARARKSLTDHNRHQLEVLVSDWVNQEAAKILDGNQRWKAQRLEHHGRRIIPGDYVQAWPWSAKVRTSSSYFIPLSYGRDKRLTARMSEPTAVLQGLYLRVTEHRQLLYKPAQATMPPEFNLESDARNNLVLTINRRQIQPLQRRFVLASIEQLPDQTLAAIYKACL